MNSHECPVYRTGRYCARIAQVSSKKKNEKLQSSSSGAGSVTQWIGSESTQSEWGFEKGFSALATGFENSQQGSPPIAPAVKVPANMPLCMDNRKNVVPGSYLAVIFFIIDDDYKFNVLSIGQGRPGWHSVSDRHRRH